MALHGSLGARSDNANALDAYVTAFIVFQMIGLCGCTLMLFTALLGRDVVRHFTWFSFVFSFLVSTTSYCLLFFAGQLYNRTPPYPLCLTQAALIYAVPSLNAGATLALVGQLYFNVHNQMAEHRHRAQKFWSALLLIFPYCYFWAMVIACLVIGSTHRTAVLGPFVGGSYCFLGVPAPAKISAITVAVLLLPTIALEVSIGRMLHKNWLVLRHQNHFPLNTVIRILVFTAVGILVIGLGVVFAIMQLPDPRLNIIIAIVPVAAVLIFGTQPDLLRVWTSCGWKPTASLTTSRPRVHDLNSRTRLVALAPKAPQLPDFHEVPVYDGSSNIKPPTLLSGPPQTWTIRPERKTPPSDF